MAQCSVSLDMARHRFVVLLPIIAVVVTSGLWLSARAQYRSFLCPPAGVCPSNLWLGSADYTPPSMQAAGMLNIPVAFFARPLYRLVYNTVNKWELIALLLGVAVLWSYIGWRLDTVSSAPPSRTAWRTFAAILGCAFAVLVLIEAITMFHVGLLYKTIAVFWSLLMFRHFMLLLRTSPPVPQHGQQSRRWRLPRITLARIAMCWAAFLVVAALALPPLDSSGRPRPALAHVVALGCAFLLLTTAYAVVVYLVTAWRNIPTPPSRPTYVVWVGFETFLAVAADAAVLYTLLRG